ncbi:thiamine transporter 2-like [Canna indica]|uniref:Thiamine transporter 2-like n=1 Tax=Canna indica TaxID=4628 RepID=A0AAQ3KVB8_9LILI|nr:thiamine transporter 2-like [Canna indica]
MGWQGWLSSVVPRSSSLSRPLLAVLLTYSFSSQFLPIEPYLVPYLTSVKNFTNYQVTNKIFPVSVYAQLIFTLIMAPVCYYLSHKVMITLGAFALLLTYLIAWCGQSLIAMQIMQVVYGFGTSARLVFSSYIFLLVPEEDYQIMTSLTQTISLLSFVLASELGQLLALKEAPYEIFFIISLAALGGCCTLSFLLPDDYSFSSLSSLTTFLGPNEGWVAKLKETWDSQSLKIMSLWWAVAFAGISLVQNYGTNLFDAIDSQSKFNGHILAISEAAGSIGSYYAIYIEKFGNRSRHLIYVLGSLFMGILCVGMGVYANIWGVYVSYVMIGAIYRTFACLVSVQCGRLLSNGQYILMFSINNFVGLLIETVLQAAVEVAGLSIYSQFIAFSGMFFLATAIFIGFSCIDYRKDESNKFVISESGPDYILACDT